MVSEKLDLLREKMNTSYEELKREVIARGLVFDAKNVRVEHTMNKDGLDVTLKYVLKEGK